jgi:hypothetical protein
MNRVAVRSSMIRAWAFNDDTGVLELEFTNGRVYQYQGVPSFIAKGFEVSRSKGRFFLTRIDKRYPNQEVRG